jgi:SAM-dependent methyltransferase
MHIFDRSGIAALTDLQAPEWRAVYSLLEKEQGEFLAKEEQFRSPEYKWPHDPLHTWSRVWEYPYVYHHLQKTEVPLRVVDLGSGVTFFPFSVARLGYHVTCMDTDPIVSMDLPRAAKVTDQSPGQVNYRQCDDSHLPFADSEVNAVYCISVIEHIDRFEDTVDEITRILTPGGILLLTVDLDLRGGSQLGVSEYQRLMTMIRQHFDCVYPETTVHPADMLTSSHGPYGFTEPRGLTRTTFFLKQNVIKPLLGKTPVPMLPILLGVAGFTLRRRR